MFDKENKYKKAEGMSVGLMVAIAIGVAIIVLMYFIIFRGGRNVSIAGSCEDSFCSVSTNDCKDMPESARKDVSYTKSLTTCKVGDKTGKCCVPEDFG